MKNLINKWPCVDEIEYIKNARYITVHTAQEDGFHFLLGPAIIKHKGVLRVCFSNSLKTENDDHTILTEKYSNDDGKTWTKHTIANCDSSYGRSHGVYFEYDNKLYVFCPRAKFDKIDKYPDLKMEGYVLGDNGEYKYLGIIIDGPFWPMCSPIQLSDGKYIMAGLNPDTGESNVAIMQNDINNWRVVKVQSHPGFKNWGECTLIKREDDLILFSRGGGKAGVLVSISKDEGETWSPFEESNIQIAHSKLYSGALSNGKEYLVFNYRTENETRDLLAIASGNKVFDKVQIIRHGFKSKPKYWFANEWCYPYAYEDKESRMLYIVYASDKENCELVIVPISEI